MEIPEINSSQAQSQKGSSSLPSYPNNLSDRRQFVRDSIYASLPVILGALGGLIAIPIISKLMGSMAYGIWVQFQVSIVLVSFFASLNLGHSMSRFLVGSQSKTKLIRDLYAILLLVFSIAVVFGGILFLARDPLAKFLFGDGKYASVIIIMAVCLSPFVVNIACMAFLRARRLNKQLAFLMAGKLSIQMLVIALVASYTSSIELVLASFTGIELLVALFSLLYIHLFLFKRSLPAVSFDNIPMYLKFGVPLLSVNLAYWIVQFSDRYLIGYFMDVSQVGVYSIAYALGGIIGMLLIPVVTVLLPDLSALYERKAIGELELRFQKVQKYYVAIGSAAIVGLVILAEPLIKVVSSPEFVAGVHPLIVLAIGFFLYGLFTLYTQLLNVLKTVRLLSFIWGGIALLNFGANMVLIPMIGLMGAAISTCVSFLIGGVISGIYAARSFKLNFRFNWLGQIALSLGAMATVLYFIPCRSLAWLLLAVLCGVIIYGLCLKASGFLDATELRFIKETISLWRRH